MFDVGISELGVIGVVALVVLGPERLPKVARAAGQWVGKVQRYMNDVKADINREAALSELKAAQESMQKVMHGFEQDVNAEVNQIQESLSINDSPPYSTPGRKKNLRARRAAVPLWYKRQQGLRTYVQSGAARVKRHRKNKFS